METTPTGPVLLVGGTFDPPHRAHVTVARAIAERLGVGRTVFIPAGRNPHKAERPRTSDADRLAMLHLALRAWADATIVTLELDRDGPSYFIDTLEVLHAAWPDATLRFLIGADQAVAFSRWHRADDILALATPAIALRAPWDDDALRRAIADDHRDAERWMAWVVPLPLMDESGTALRAALAAGAEAPDEWLDPAVAAYIRARGLYRDENDANV